MPGHEFEKKVQQRMEELHLPPSEAVWNRVELEIRKDKRRRLLLLLFPLLLLLGIGSYFVLQQTTGSSIVKSDKKATNATKNSITDPDDVTVSPAATPVENSAGKNPVNSTDQKTASGIAEDNTTIVATDHSTDISEVNDANNKQTSKHETIKKQKAGIVIHTSQSKGRKTSKAPVLLVENNSKENIAGKAKSEEKPMADKTQAKPDPSSTAIVDSAVVANPTVQTIQQPADSAVALKNKRNTETKTNPAEKKTTKQSKNWQWGIVAGAGVSKVSEGGLFNAFEKSLVMDAAYNGGMSTNNPPPTNSNSKPATIKTGLNWNLGMFVQRRISKKMELSAALQYNYFSTNSEIGPRVDSTRIINNGSSNSLQVNGFYLNSGYTNGNSTGNTTYRSNYHFLELPITLHIQLNNNKKTPFYWNNGLSIGQLLSTNVLHYDGSTGIYYKDDNLLRKTQLGFHTGLSLKLFSQSKYPLELGPQFNYLFTNLLKEEDADKRHLLSGSLLLRWYIKK